MNAYDEALRPLLLEAERKNQVDLSIMQRISNLVADFERDKDVARQSLHRGLAALTDSLSAPIQPQAHPLNSGPKNRPVGPPHVN
jgi:hypothetical protein